MSAPVPAMRRGDVFWVDLDPARGSEAPKSRPAVVVSNDGANTASHRHGRGVVTIVPVTSNTTRVYPFQVLIKAADHPGLRNDSKAQAEQVRTVDVSRVGRRITTLNPETMKRLDAALRLHLAL
ncbi:mRNA interferase MazF [Catenulispora sp. GP43]